MGNPRWLAACGLISLAAVPAAGHAGDRLALNACVKSFVSTYLSDRIVRVDRRVADSSPITRHRGKYTIELTARGTKSGQQLAQATCVASGRGDVLVLENLPPEDTRSARADFIVDLK